MQNDTSLMQNPGQYLINIELQGYKDNTYYIAHA